MGIVRPGAIARREFMLGAGASLLAACGVMRQVQNTETLSSAPLASALRPVLAALITSVLPFEHPRFPALAVDDLERTLLEMFPIESDPELAEMLTSAHPQATTRMGADPRRATLNSRGETHSVPNLIVCDASAFPASCGANPMILIMAMARYQGLRVLGESARYDL